MNRVSRRRAIQTTFSALAAGLTFPLNLLAAPSESPALPEAAWNNLPCWHGFNLLEMFMRGWMNQEFVEDDFRFMRDEGFNFARLPMDYRTWILDNDWRRIDESSVKRIDRAVEWGRKYGVHIMLNLHRAPGYTVAEPPEKESVWDSDEALNVCTEHWTMFAKRFAGIPSCNLSFNLFNEPKKVEMDKFMKVHRHLIEAIRAIDPGRLIICDGLNCGATPVPELASLKVGQATRGYSPLTVSHYKASWVKGDDRFVPSWPDPFCSGMIYVPHKGGVDDENTGPMLIVGSFDRDTVLRLKLKQVSYRADLLVEADDTAILTRTFKPGPGTGEWTQVVCREGSNTYQNYYDLDIFATIPAGTQKVSVRLTGGDWAIFSELGLTPQSYPETILPLRVENIWNQPPLERVWKHMEDGRYAFSGGKSKDRKWLYDKIVKRWEVLRPFGRCVMVGEFGAFNKTPHEVVLRWMEDMFINWKEQGWGWAMWNLRGSFGILDSKREDVQYQTVGEHLLDRKMLNLIQKYM